MRLTKEQIEARMAMYDEAVAHMYMSIHDTPEEERQAKVVALQIRKLALNFSDKYSDIIEMEGRV